MPRKVLPAVTLAALAAGNAAAATPPCAEGPFRQFDFWAGEWDVRDAAGKPAGVNTITKDENGCVLVERWRSASGGSGQSYNYYDPSDKKWKQLWVGFNLLLHMEGGLSDGTMRLEGPLQYLGQNRTTILRGTWSQLPDGRVRQLFEESEDEGATWTVWFDGYYTRR
ncbi:MAG: hypothetical protein ACREST_10490 [Steroidobacteraceae bacterium]